MSDSEVRRLELRIAGWAKEVEERIEALEHLRQSPAPVRDRGLGLREGEPVSDPGPGPEVSLNECGFSHPTCEQGCEQGVCWLEILFEEQNEQTGEEAA